MANNKQFIIKSNNDPRIESHYFKNKIDIDRNLNYIKKIKDEGRYVCTQNNS
jgi:hypothetical protein